MSAYKSISTHEERMGILHEAYSSAAVNVASDCSVLIRRDMAKSEENERLRKRVAELEEIIENCTECRLTKKLVDSFSPNEEWNS